MSLDGFIAREDDGVGPLFDWYEAGSGGKPGCQATLCRFISVKPTPTTGSHFRGRERSSPAGGSSTWQRGGAVTRPMSHQPLS